MKEVYERIIELAEYYKVSKPSEFAKKTGFSHQVATNYLKGKRNPTRESLNTILITFSDISSEWLLTGEGPMLKPSVTMFFEDNKPEVKKESNNELEYLKMKTELLQELLKGREEVIEMLKEKVKELESRKN